VTSVFTSFALFLARGGLVLSGRRLPHKMALRILPHAVDTILLASAVWLAAFLHQYPFVHHWLTTKVLLLVVYVVLGSFALKRARSRAGQTLAFGLACLTFAAIVAVARAHHPLGMLAPFR
jgi:uncharacterized membrane protein SirB2